MQITDITNIQKTPKEASSKTQKNEDEDEYGFYFLNIWLLLSGIYPNYLNQWILLLLGFLFTFRYMRT